MDYDTVVIGSGFGAACAAYELAAAGERVLMLERGTRVARGRQAWLPNGSAELTAHYWSAVAQRPDGAPIGGHACVGGPSVFFGAVAMGMRAADFAPSPEIVARSRALWPLRYDDPDHSLSRARDVVDLIDRIYREIDPARRRPSLATV